MLRKEMYTWFLCVFLYKAGRSGLLRLPAFVPFLALAHLRSTLSFSVSDLECLNMRNCPPTLTQTRPVTPPLARDESDHHGVKIDLYIFIYVYIKKEGGCGVWGGGAGHDPRASGPRGGGGRGGPMQRGGEGGCGGARAGRALSAAG